MENKEVLNTLPDEKLQSVNGGDGSAVFGTNIEPDWQPCEITFTEAPQGSSGGAIYIRQS